MTEDDGFAVRARGHGAKPPRGHRFGGDNKRSVWSCGNRALSALLSRAQCRRDLRRSPRRISRSTRIARHPSAATASLTQRSHDGRNSLLCGLSQNPRKGPAHEYGTRSQRCRGTPALSAAMATRPRAAGALDGSKFRHVFLARCLPVKCLMFWRQFGARPRLPQT
jgi:hypothetical protein